MNVLFICTGNVFRSMTAEHALQHMPLLPRHVSAGSAGIIDAPHGVLDFVTTHMTRKSIDIANHRPRKLTRDILDAADVAVAMGLDHQHYVATEFGRRIPLFTEVAFGITEPLQDVWEVIPDWRNNPDKAHAYAWYIMDRIFEGMPSFVERMGGFRKP